MDNNSVFIEKLRSSGLRPTKQRLEICKLLFDRKKTFHFTISDLSKILIKETDEKISLATIYNTVHSFKKKGI
jgi:Fur family iron response transcriptional regulator